MSEPSTAVRFLPAAQGLRGTITVPGDKSISHRAVLLGAVNSGPVSVTGFLRSADCLASVAAVRALGVRVEEQGDDLVVHGTGWEGLREPDDVIDVANSGTLIRLLPGLVAGSPLLCVFTGDASIRRRPMRRILEPLAAMGATVAGRAQDSLPPFSIRGGALRGMRHELTVASAQVKSCLLLAGLRASGQTVVVEPGLSRDHTERMLRHAGAEVVSADRGEGAGIVTLSPVERLDLPAVTVPGDFSSAAFLLVAALLVPESQVTVEKVGLNPTRTGLLDVLERMGADLSVEPGQTTGPEPVGRITARSTSLLATEVGAAEVPNVIDELPLFLLAAAKAEGVSRLRGAAELRAKESDRLAAMAALLRGLGVTVTEHEDGLDVVGDPRGWQGGVITSAGDHRIAMVGAVAGVASREGTYVDDIGCIAVSFPGFVERLRLIGGRYA
jgi:3-phosphoshikimate 1-carboxyvinyltransferase